MQRAINVDSVEREAPFAFQQSVLYHDDCFSWIERQEDCSIHAVVSDPPYGLYEYTEEQQSKLRSGKGGYGGFHRRLMEARGLRCRGLPLFIGSNSSS